MTVKKSELWIKVKDEPVILPWLKDFLTVWSAAFSWLLYLSSCLLPKLPMLAAAGITVILAVVCPKGRHVGRDRQIIAGVLLLTAAVFSILFIPVREQWLGILDYAAKNLADKGIMFCSFLSGSFTQTGETEWIYYCIAVISFAGVLLFGTLLRWKRFFFFFFIVPPLFFMLRTGWMPGIMTLLLFLFCCVCLLAPSFQGAIVCIVFTAMLTGVFYGVYGDLTQQSQNKASAVEQKWEQWKYNNCIHVLPQGRINDAAKEERGEQTALYVQMQTPSPYYLRGFTGTVFQDNVWSSSYEVLESFGGAQKEDRIGRLISSKLQKNQTQDNQSDENQSNQKEINVLKITNVGADRRYLYLPYENRISAGQYEEEGVAVLGTGENLFSAGLRGKRTFSSEASLCLAGQIKKIDAEQKEEQSYQNDINRIYLTLTKEEKEIIASVFDGKEKGTAITAISAARKIRRWMEDNIVYNSNPGKIPEGESFAQWFFQEKKQGYDVHYAAAAVMFFRYYGIPARYVEGYLVTPEAISRTDSRGQIEITQNAAHAWPEIYLTGIGWIPVEVMPQYEERMGVSYLEGWQKPYTDSGQTREEKTQEEIRQEKTQRKENEQTETKQKEDGQTEKIPVSQSKGKVKKGTIIEKVWSEKEKYMIAAAVLLLAAGIFGRITINRSRERQWELSGDKGLCVRMYYLKLCLLLALLENKKGIWKDNRIKTAEKLLKKWDADVNIKEWQAVCRIRQKAVYGAGDITEEEQRQACTFLKEEICRLKHKLSLGARIRLCLGNEKKTLASLQKIS